MTGEESGGGDFGAKFMLQEHSRIIDAYHDLHVQKNELLKFYLAFVSIPLSVVALFLSLSRFVPSGDSGANATRGSLSNQAVPTGTAGSNLAAGSASTQAPATGTCRTNATPGAAISQPPPTGSPRTNATSGPAPSQPPPAETPGATPTQNASQLPSLVGSLRDAATYLSLLLVPIGIAVIRTMLDIRTEQYLYAQTVNAARNFFKTTYDIKKQYFVLPFDPKDIVFGANEARGRTFWEAMIVSSPTSLLFGFLVYRLLQVLGCRGESELLVCVLAALATFIGLSWFVSSEITKRLRVLQDRIDQIHKPDATPPSSTALTGGKEARPPAG